MVVKKMSISRCYSQPSTASCVPKTMKERMEAEARHEVERICALDYAGLKEEYNARFDGDDSFSEVFMRRRLCQIAQEDALGGLSPNEVAMLERVARNDSRGTPKPAKRALPPVRGTTYSRMYKGRLVEVKAAGYGQYEYGGQLYRSLTAAVEAITGTHFSGRKFFAGEGLRRPARF